MTYASTLTRDPFATYRQIDAVGRTATADGPALHFEQSGKSAVFPVPGGG